MEFAYGLFGSMTPLVMSHVIGESVSNAGVPLTVPAAGETGLHNATTTSAADMMGVSLDTGTYTTSQDNSTDIEATVKVIVSPDAVYRVKMSGGATEDTALTLFTVDTANSAGTSVETDNAFDSADMDEGVVWGFSGANAGQRRKITATSGNHATVTVPFASISVDDEFLAAPYWFGSADNVQLTTNLFEADASIVVGTGAELRVLDMLLRDTSGDGRNNSFIYVVSDDHVFGHRPT